MGLPFTSHHGGQILFGPEDGYMYLMMGDGGGVGGDPYNFSQNKKSLLGKIMRLDVDNIPSKPQQRLLYSGFVKMIYLHKLELLLVLFFLCFDLFSGAEEIDKLGLWGNYSAPKDNPFREDPELQPEIWAVGLRNPWRCSFDSERPSYFICADVGQVRTVLYWQVV